jgi:hypothetical protein
MIIIDVALIKCEEGMVSVGGDEYIHIYGTLKLQQ